VSFILIVSHNLERVDVTFFAQASLNNIEYKKVDDVKTPDDSSI
jgi:hypothetical protein